MDHPNLLVTLTADPSRLPTSWAKKVRSAITTVEHCLGLWQPFLTAATTQPLHITITTTGEPHSETTPAVGSRLDTARWNLHLRIPHSLLKEPTNQLAAHILDIVVPALVLLTEHHPHPQQPAFWNHPPGWQPPPPEPDDPEAGIQLEHLLDDDPLIVGRHDGTPAGKETREDTLQEYLCERLEAPGIAVYDHLILTNTAVGWNLELLPRD